MKKSMLSYELRDYAVALFLALLLNVGLFALMPGLIRSDPGRPKLEKIVAGIQVIRMKRPEPPVRKKEKAEPPDLEKKPEQTPARPIVTERFVMKKMQLPFQLNPKLPEGPGTLPIPKPDMVSVPVPAIRDTVSATEIDTPLTPVVQVPPIYPIRAKRMGIEGNVTVTFTVSREGRVENVDIVDANPPDVFETAVIRCVSRWRFKPPTVEGVPVNARAETTIRFQLKD